MKLCLRGLFCGMGGLLLACTTSKLKYANSLHSREEWSGYEDSSFTKYHVGRTVRNDQSSYNGLWWLKGNVQLNPDSGLQADEAWLYYNGDYTTMQQGTDSTWQNAVHQYAAQEERQQLVQQTQKTKEGVIKLPWYTYAGLITIAVMLLWRMLKSLRGIQPP